MKTVEEALLDLIACFRPRLENRVSLTREGTTRNWRVVINHVSGKHWTSTSADAKEAICGAAREASDGCLYASEHEALARFLAGVAEPGGSDEPR